MDESERNEPSPPEEPDLETLEQRVLNWEAPDACIDDDLHEYFSHWNGRDWVTVAEEGRRMYNLMFHEEVEEYSPIDALLYAISAQAATGVFIAVGNALGIGADALEAAVHEWYWSIKPGEIGPEPIGWEKVRKDVESVEEGSTLEDNTEFECWFDRSG